MTITIHGIRNCDTMKKAFAWLKDHQIEARFHDYKTAGIDAGRLQDWAAQVGWEVLLNRAGTTFRALADTEKANIDEARAIGLMLAQPSMIKRPVLDVDGRIVVGFKPEIYAALFGKAG